MRRVVITGIGALSPLGHDWPTVLARLRSQKNVVRIMPGWEEYAGLNTRVGAPAAPIEFSATTYHRKRTRSMGRVALLSVRATEMALADAGLLGKEMLSSGQVGIAYGSSSGSPPSIAEMGGMLVNKTTANITATTYIRMMSHTAAVNIGIFFGIQGRIIPVSSACTSGSQSIGYAYETIQNGRQSVMLAGGAEELDPTQAAIFDALFATSVKYNEMPWLTPRPFAADRDGLVLGEGACTLVLEDLQHALDRGARIVAEVVGFGTNSDGAHVTQPHSSTMAQAMRLALESAQMSPNDVGYVNAHGTATDQGDIAESQATHEVFGQRIPISSLKSYMGHTLGACGALEAWMTVAMMQEEWFAPTLNLGQVDARCASLDYIREEGRNISTDVVMSNNFAFGGINTALIFRRWPHERK